LQDERDKIAQLEDVIRRMEEDLRRLDSELQAREKSINSLQFEKANLAATVERQKGSEASTSDIHVPRTLS
jgi:uncharacterized protein HemX